MKFLSSLAFLSALAAPIFASPALEERGGKHYHKPACLSDSDAWYFIKKYVATYAGSTKYVYSTFDKSYEIFDGNTNFLFGSPPGTPYAKGPDNKGKPGALPGVLQVVTFPKPYYDIKISVDYKLHDCKSVAFKWTLTGKFAGDPASTTPKGAPISFSGLEIVQVDPKTKKAAGPAWTNSDVLPMLYQLGSKVCFQGGKTGCPS